MTHEQIEMHRRRFEELEIASGESICWDDCDNLYWRDSQNQRWRGYLLCADNLEVELPDSWFSENHQEYILSNSEVQKYLESQGIKVKP